MSQTDGEFMSCSLGEYSDLVACEPSLSLSHRQHACELMSQTDGELMSCSLGEYSDLVACEPSLSLSLTACS